MVKANDTGKSMTIRRTLNASRQRVFDAWTQPEHLKSWWRANPGWTTEIADVDLQVGGKYRLGMRDPEQDAPFVCFGEFIEVAPPEKLVYTWSWEPTGMDVGETLVTVEFIEKGEATEVVVTHERFPDSDAATKHNGGWSGCLDNLVALVEQD